MLNFQFHQLIRCFSFRIPKHFWVETQGLISNSEPYEMMMYHHLLRVLRHGQTAGGSSSAASLYLCAGLLGLCCWWAPFCLMILSVDLAQWFFLMLEIIWGCTSAVPSAMLSFAFLLPFDLWNQSWMNWTFLFNTTWFFWRQDLPCWWACICQQSLLWAQSLFKKKSCQRITVLFWLINLRAIGMFQWAPLSSTGMCNIPIS